METKELISTYRPNCNTANLKVEENFFALHSINLQGFISVTLHQICSPLTSDREAAERGRRKYTFYLAVNG